jgi:phosphate transport system substrate-binding protein
MLGGLSSTHAATPTRMIKIDGSSTVFPVTEAVAEDFQKQKENKGVRVTVGISGTGGGFKKFCRGETDVQNASRPISKEEMETCKKAGISYFELPVAYDAIVVAVHKDNALNEISVDELKKIWEPASQGTVTRWNQVNSKWSPTEFKLYGAGADSGTFDYFTEAIVGKAKSSRGDYTASEDDNTLVSGISTDKNAIGYLPFAYYEPNKGKMKALKIIGGAKAPKQSMGVAASKETIIDGTYFPLARPVFIYVAQKSSERPEIKNFVKFFMEKGSDLISSVKYVPLPQSAYVTALGHFNKGKVGTIFGGHTEVGLKIEELLKREAKF